jgi:hypothetical protein
MIDPKSTLAEVKENRVKSIFAEAKEWEVREIASPTPDDRANASRIRRFLESVARFAESQG